MTGRCSYPSRRSFSGPTPWWPALTGRRALRFYLALPDHTRQLLRYGLDEPDLTGEGRYRFIDVILGLTP
ncbi:hypothetical protein KZ829_18810 [Actinoplanes hulinensis]|uniref:Uncharacterized protein n=1 Tax=Actinoplanes hulinensis TaxID=1144547 RepID=A0ABS7B432_9ACTN|nr:hypothetical protein [Actinoplanes hulinensis]MBW6435796.1 hypothetical protein [Actinoplanes hulinensis]